MSHLRVRLSQVEDGKILKEIVCWFQRFKEAGFAEKLDALWKETHQAAESAGYGPDDVDRLIAEVRKRNGPV